MVTANFGISLYLGFSKASTSLSLIIVELFACEKIHPLEFILFKSPDHHTLNLHVSLLDLPLITVISWTHEMARSY